jgi:hypothetical protein
MFVVYMLDGREFHVHAYSAGVARRIVTDLTFGRGEIVEVREIH